MVADPPAQTSTQAQVQVRKSSALLDSILRSLKEVAARGEYYINVSPADVLVAYAGRDFHDREVVTVVLRNGIILEAYVGSDYIRVRSAHECYCDGG